MPRRSRLHTPKPHSRPGEKPDFSYLETSPAGAVPRPDVNARVRDIGNLATELVRVLDDEHRAVGPWHPHLDAPDLQIGLQAHAAHASVRRSHAAHAAPGKDHLLHALARRGSRVGRAGDGAAPRGHAVPVVPQPGALHGPRAAARRPDVPAAVEHARHVQGPAAARDVSLGGGADLLDLGQPRDPVPAGRRLGDGRSDQGRGRHCRQLAGRGLERRGRFSPRDAVCLGVPGAGDPQRRQQPVGDLDLPGIRGRRAALVCGARPRLRDGGHPRRRQRFPRRVRGDAVGRRAGAARRGPDPDRARDLPGRGALDQRRSVALPPEGRLREVAARRPGRSPEEPPDRARRVVGGEACGAHRRARCAGRSRVEGSRDAWNARRGTAARPGHDVRGCFQGSARSPASASANRCARSRAEPWPG